NKLYNPQDTCTDIFNLYTADTIQNAGIYYFNFTGKDDDNLDLPDYLYYYRGSAATLDGNVSPPMYLRIGIDKYPIYGEITNIPDYFNPDQEQLNIIYNVSEDCYVTISLLKNNTTIRNILNKSIVESGVKSFLWDGKEADGDIFDEGQYTIQIRLDDITENSNKILTKDVYINSEAPIIKDVFASPVVFSATVYDKQNTTLYYTLEDQYYDISGTKPLVSIKLNDESDTFIKDILIEQEQKPGQYSYTWDGTGVDNISYVTDGAYYFLITTKDNANNSMSYRQDVIKNTIISSIDSPTENQVLSSKEVEIIGTATNLLSFKCFTLEYAQGKIDDDDIDSTEWEGIKVLSEL
ncbi:MAG: hypothetical protein KAT05_03715, partial [Spirochaetes bacterium]|nr:hypothetical protein [Spirochaetota bacterium]